MNDSVQSCAECGSELPAHVPPGLCPHCALSAVLESTPAETSALSAPEVGGRIGRYKLLEKIGEGGCGVVYMAEQEEPVRRRVALKVIKLGMDTREVIARFEAERQALALMEHPHIAKVFDGGATQTGRPYFVMELVRGLRITDYCDQKNLSTRQRLDLFMQVCQAVQHAHQKGIIHRDLKPSNILVTVNDAVTVPKVIDFGIAKATGQRLTDKTLFTKFQQLVGTPAYMSPEQAEMTTVDIDTRSDIYSLGVLLYELLTGKTPFDGKELLASGLEAMVRAIREREPLKPSTRLNTMANADQSTVASQRQTEPAKLATLLRGDLDWIVMKALEKDRTRRYETVNGLALDIQRHLRNETVVAVPPGNLYRFEKLVRRNKLAFAATAVIAATLLLGMGFSSWQYFEKGKAYSRAVKAEQDQRTLRVQAETARTAEAQLKKEAQAQELTALQKSYASDMILAQQSLAQNNLGRAEDLLNRHRRDVRWGELRGWEWRHLWQWRLCALAETADGS
jgi:eukaryotic-like serine/threonine-protein kinase